MLLVYEYVYNFLVKKFPDWNRKKNSLSAVNIIKSEKFFNLVFGNW